MEMVIKKLGNRLAASIPAAIANSLKIEAQGGKIILTPVKDVTYNLDDLLKDCPKKRLRPRRKTGSG